MVDHGNTEVSDKHSVDVSTNVLVNIDVGSVLCQMKRNILSKLKYLDTMSLIS